MSLKFMSLINLGWRDFMYFNTKIWNGKGSGNERGYLVEMLDYYPKSGFIKIKDGGTQISK